MNDECAAHGSVYASDEGEVDGEVDAAGAAPAGVARSVEDEDEEDADEGEGDEDEGWDGAVGGVAGEQGYADDEEDGGKEAQDGGGVDGAGVVSLGDVVRGWADETRVDGGDRVGVGVGGKAGGRGDAVEGAGGGGGLGGFAGGGHWDVGWGFGEGDVV